MGLTPHETAATSTGGTRPGKDPQRSTPRLRHQPVDLSQRNRAGLDSFVSRDREARSGEAPLT